MKNVLLIVFLSCISSLLSQIIYQQSIDKAFRLANEQKKIVFLKYYANTCSHCKDLQAVLDIDTVSQIYNQNFVSCKIDAEALTEKDIEFLDKYHFKIDQTPFMFFFEPDGTFIHYATPKQVPASVMNVARNVLNPQERCTYYPTKYKQGVRDIITLKMYSKYAQLMGDDSLIDQLANDIFEQTPQTELLTQNSIVSTAKYVKRIDNGFFTFWMEHYQKLDSVAPSFSLEEKQKVFKDILADDINKHAKEWNLDQINTAKKYIELTNLNTNKNIFTWERELELLFQQKTHEKASIFINELILNSKDNLYLSNYITEVCFKLATMNEDYNFLIEKIKELRQQELTEDLDVSFMCIQLKCYSKLRNETEFLKLKQDFLKVCKKSAIEAQNDCLIY